MWAHAQADGVPSRWKQEPQLGCTAMKGAITGVVAAGEQGLEQVEGVMMGRGAERRPGVLAGGGQRLFGDDHAMPSRHQIIEQMMPFVEQEFARGIPRTRITRHILGLFHGQPGAKAWCFF